MSMATAGLEDEFRNYGIDVVEVTDPGDRIELTYMTAFPGFEIHHWEMGRALNALIDLEADGEWEPTRLDATVVRAPGDPMGTWYAKQAWFEGYANYRLSDEDLSEKVISTVEHVDEEP
ncbi:hypothetical protein [Natronocalculus amylovorans]|uniref:DUF8159 domain-containing protein n=1 Tax=Natronocalculus amylovorans TaxID=2917812 RepID=A0AAE3FWM6_9EURY|nr:hypothetical protein [Natronocalculus amylovorans]MCL9816714.1 hypothetical protein [Natronocalculus amylovorans]NUE01161.1 hypothetical protein [Halorubraceae archaeon YAN]